MGGVKGEGKKEDGLKSDGLKVEDFPDHLHPSPLTLSGRLFQLLFEEGDDHNPDLPLAPQADFFGRGT